MNENYKKMFDVIDKQENLLRFKHFTNEDALELGNFIVKEAANNKLAMAVAIRKTNGAILYHHLMTGTTRNNQNWMERKFNTVCQFEHASLRCFVAEKLTDEDVKKHGLNDDKYVFCGGGFPITLETGEFVGVAIVSNLPHFEDHKFLVNCLSKWLNVSGVPEVTEI